MLSQVPQAAWKSMPIVTNVGVLIEGVRGFVMCLRHCIIALQQR